MTDTKYPTSETTIITEESLMTDMDTKMEVRAHTDSEGILSFVSVYNPENGTVYGMNPVTVAEVGKIYNHQRALELDRAITKAGQDAIFGSTEETPKDYRYYAHYTDDDFHFTHERKHLMSQGLVIKGQFKDSHLEAEHHIFPVINQWAIQGQNRRHNTLEDAIGAAEELLRRSLSVSADMEAQLVAVIGVN